MYYSERLRLRAPERSDLPLFVTWLNDEEVINGLTIVYPLGSEEEAHWFDTMLQQPPEMHPFVIEAKDGETWKPIGNCGFHDVDWRNSNAELGIFIGDKTYWNNGYGAEAIRLLLKVGFETMNLHRIWLRVQGNNARAIHCYEKVGFVHEGRKREAEYKNGRYHDMILMSVLRDEWLPK